MASAARLFVALSLLDVTCSPAPSSEPPQRTAAPAAPSPTAPIVCDRFKIVQSRTGAALTVSLETDLPDYTDVMVSVSRSYRERGNTKDEYSLDYFQEKSTVGQWRQAKRIPIAHELFEKALQERQRTTSLAGIGFDLGSVSPDVTVSFVVPIFQRNPTFGENNKNLSGKAVTTNGKMRNVTAEERVPYPLGRAGGTESQWANAKGLLAGRTYRLSRETLLMPDDDSLDPLVAVAARRTIPANGTITVREVVNRRGEIWYRVEARTRTDRVGAGLLNSDALIGQEIRAERSPK